MSFANLRRLSSLMWPSLRCHRLLFFCALANTTCLFSRRFSLYMFPTIVAGAIILFWLLKILHPFESKITLFPRLVISLTDNRFVAKSGTYRTSLTLTVATNSHTETSKSTSPWLSTGIYLLSVNVTFLFLIFLMSFIQLLQSHVCRRAGVNVPFILICFA